ncbi:hypothetical protein [Lunatibacter salilacus]|uniref:hypothetical protein n=1 Tax=Lunatibacter salilacus TaxID=2483804 RepID=UPI00131B851A|nr:hypothetical protein [Lunatibacter salilacus]
MYNIVTCISVDQDKTGGKVKYPNIGTENKNRKHVYWRCAYTFCAASVKVNPEKKHIVVTNDLEEIIIDNINVKDELAGLGVTIIYLDFDRFDPGKHSMRFRNAFYKLQVIERLAQETLPSLLLDSDILWHKKDVVLDDIMSSGEYLVLQDTYQRSNKPLEKLHNISMKDMGDLYRLIGIQGYNQPYPIWYGGELIGGSPQTLGKVAKNILELLNYCKEEDNKGNKFLFPNGNSIFDGDEFISSYVYNSMDVKIYDSYNRHIKRLWTAEVYNNVSEGDENIPIWHLISEKGTGLKQLFYESVNPDSEFWNCTDFTEYLGKYVGIPKRNFKDKSSTVKSGDLIYDQLRFLNSRRKRLKWWYYMRFKKRR